MLYFSMMGNAPLEVSMKTKSHLQMTCTVLHCAAALSSGMPLQKQPWAGLRDELLCVL